MFACFSVPSFCALVAFFVTLLPVTALADSRAFGPFLIDDAQPGVVRLEGEIVAGSALDFRRVLAAVPNTKTILLDSPGGLVAIALLIADDVHERGIATEIPAGSSCFSACSLIFFAGPARTAYGALGVHQISSETPDLASAQVTISDIIDMLNRFGTPAEVLTTMFRTPASDIHVFTAEEIARYGINRTGPASATSIPSAPPASVAPAAAPSQPSPPAAPDMGRRAECQTFVERYFSDWSAINPSALARMDRDYAPAIDFYGKGVSKAALMEEKRRFAERWPERSYAVRPGSLAVRVATRTCAVTGIVDWSAHSEILHKSPRGAASFGFGLDASSPPLIVRESAKPIRADALQAEGDVASAAPPPAGLSNVQFVNGECAPSSHTAEGPIGSDLTQRQSRFFCDAAVINFFSNYKGHVMVQFAQKGSHHDPVIGFAGTVGEDGIMMAVDHVYLAPSQPTTVSEGFCKFFFKSRTMSGIACGMKVDENGRRTTAIVGFDAAPEQ